MTYTALAVFNIVFAVPIMVTTLFDRKYWEDPPMIALTFIWIALHVLNAIALLMR